jgi:hypothetical protein
MYARRFYVFGRIYLIRRKGSSWVPYTASGDGKHAPAGFAIPDFVLEDELVQYLEDLFHENATPSNGNVHAID